MEKAQIMLGSKNLSTNNLNEKCDYEKNGKCSHNDNIYWDCDLKYCPLRNKKGV